MILRQFRTQQRARFPTQVMLPLSEVFNLRHEHHTIFRWEVVQSDFFWMRRPQETGGIQGDARVDCRVYLIALQQHFEVLAALLSHLVQSRKPIYCHSFCSYVGEDFM